VYRELTDWIKIHLLNPDIDNYKSLNEKKKNILLQIFFFMMGALLAFFIVISIFRNNLLHIAIDTAAFLVLSGFYYIFRARKHLQLNTYFFVFIFCSISLFYVCTGGVDNIGLLFIVLLPIPVILLVGRKPGLVVLSVFFLITLIFNLFLNKPSWLAHYSFNFSLRVYICFVIISFLGYLNELVFDILYSRLQKTADSLFESWKNYKTLSMSREKFLSIISNDLKNQISGFSSMTDQLKEHFSEMEDSERMKVINVLQENSHNNVRLFQDIVKWSTLKSNTFSYTPVNIKLEKVYKNVIELFDFEIEKKNISVFLKMRSNSEVYADYDMLNSIMRNLVSNAVNYVDNNGEIMIKAEEKEDFMVVSVSDNGPGIDPEILDNLKQILKSPVIGPEYNHSGGIGLMLVHEFVESCKGKFSIENQLDKGTCVSFTIPLAE